MLSMNKIYLHIFTFSWVHTHRSSEPDLCLPRSCLPQENLMQTKAELLEERRFLRKKELLLRKKEEDLRAEKKSTLETPDA